jgi:hypothetical protein
MFLQQTPAETFNYMVLGFSVILGVLFVYIVSILVRFRNLKKDIALLQEIEVETDSND